MTIFQTCDLHRLDRTLSELNQLQVVFRLDDVGLASYKQLQVLKMFVQLQIPVNLAVIPVMITQQQISDIDQLSVDPNIFCWCQHGFKHVNHEPSGIKKSEFGFNRSAQDKLNDLISGQALLCDLLDDKFSFIFVPPWNKMDSCTSDLLDMLNYKGVSQFSQSDENILQKHKSLDMTVDLHTFTTGEHLSSVVIDTLCTKCQSGYLGIMLHHTKMDNKDFVFLSYLLHRLKFVKNVQFLTFKDVLAL